MTKPAAIDHFVQHHLHEGLLSCEHWRVTSRGKVRDLIADGDVIFMINTDRISAFDQVLGTVPLKGAMLAEQSTFWFNASRHIVPNHLIDRPDPQILVVKKAQPLLIEVVVRGYLAGSLLREDPRTRGRAYGLKLDSSLAAYQRLPEPIVTPSTKAPVGEHDESISPAEIIARGLATKQQWAAITEIATALFCDATKVAAQKGLLLVDTKYEFGLIDNALHLIDEVHTSDSSRFFLADDYEQKFAQNLAPTMLDKEFLRQHLLASGTTAAANIKLSDTLRAEVARRYFTLTEAITGEDFTPPSLGAHTRVHDYLAGAMPQNKPLQHIAPN